MGVAADPRSDRGRVRRLELDPSDRAAVVRELARRGVPLLAVLPDGLLVAATGGEIAGLGRDRGWSAARAVTPALRAALAGSPTTGLGLVVTVARPAAVARLAAATAAAGGMIRWSVTGPRPELGVIAPPASLGRVVAALAADPAVAWLSLQAGVRLVNADSAWRCQSGVPQWTPVFDRGLTGQGQVIAVVDTGLDADHCAFRDDGFGLPVTNRSLGTAVGPAHRKVLAVDFLWDADWPPGVSRWDDQGHGTFVAGCVAGDIRADGQFEGDDGMAPAARLVIQDGGYAVDDCSDLPGLGCPVRPLEPVLEQAWAQGARIHNLSWGDAENFWPLNRYTDRTADVDRYLRTHPTALVVAAAGNAGGGDDTVLSPSTGKSVISVGATEHGDAEPLCPAGFSSRGWAADGRVKPDVVAPGTAIESTAGDGLVDSDNCDYRSGSGTSFAAPTVAGLAALVRQYFADGFYPAGRAVPEDGFEPSGALVKAVLIASAVDLSPGCPDVSPPPSREQGWGLVQLDRALVFDGDPETIVVVDRRDGFATGGDSAAEVVVVTAGGPLTAVLAWYDEPSNPLAATNLVNDLDLELEGPGGTFRGNVLVDGVSVSGGQADRLNTVEVVKLAAPAAGGWTVRVRPHAVPVPPQGYALVVVGDLEPPLRRPTGRVPS